MYDAADRLTSRQFGGTGQTPLRIDLGYTVRDQIASETRYSDLAGTQLVGSSAYSYDGAERLTHLQHQNGSSSNIANYTYTHDLASRVTSDTLNGTTTSYSYDSTNQLTNDSTVTYSYDGTGNRTMTGYQTGTGNQLLNDGTWAYTFDSEGNEIKKSKGANAETWTFGYDDQNHLIWAKDSATDGGSVLMLATYTYDALGDRIEKDVWTSASGTTTVTRFAYDGHQVFADLDGSNNLQVRYLLGDQPDQYFARITTGSGASWFLPDREGSIRDITDASGVVQDHILYGGFGNISSETNPSYGGRIKHTGLQADNETGFYFAINRYYDSHTGRWISMDPLGFQAGDVNLYRYVENNSMNWTDPSGLVPPDHVPVGFPEKLPPTKDYILSDNRSPRLPRHPLKEFKGPVGEAGYLNFEGNGLLQDAQKKPPRRVIPGEIQWICPVYPGRTLYFTDADNFRGRYLGDKLPKGIEGPVKAVKLKPGMGLVFGPPSGERGEGGALRAVLDDPSKYQLKPGESLIIVPGK
jgi:RHS repeat-associated protein